MQAVCNHLKNPNSNTEDVLLQLFDGLSIYFNSTGKSKCLDYDQASMSKLGEEGWDFQV